MVAYSFNKLARVEAFMLQRSMHILEAAKCFYSSGLIATLAAAGVRKQLLLVIRQTILLCSLSGTAYIL